MDLRHCESFERERDLKCPFSFPDLPNASSGGSLNHATLPICVRRSVVCIANMSTFFARFLPCVCLSVFACTPVHSNSPTTSTDSLACFAGALTKQLSHSFVSRNMCSFVFLAGAEGQSNHPVDGSRQRFPRDSSFIKKSE